MSWECALIHTALATYICFTHYNVVIWLLAYTIGNHYTSVHISDQKSYQWFYFFCTLVPWRQPTKRSVHKLNTERWSHLVPPGRLDRRQWYRRATERRSRTNCRIQTPLKYGNTTSGVTSWFQHAGLTNEDTDHRVGIRPHAYFSRAVSHRGGRR